MHFVMILLTTVVLVRDNGQYAQADPALRQWYQEQRAPGAKSPCCSYADGDGTSVEEDVRNGDYWVRWNGSNGAWLKVPAEVVLNTPNKNGSPVVWWGVDEENEIFIRCYAPGAKL